MSRIIAITSGKGGVGKSSVCVGLGYALADLGKKVLMIELDFGLRGLDIMLGAENQIVYDLGDILSGNCEVEQAVVGAGEHPNLGLIAASSNLDFSYDTEKIFLLCENMRKYFDYIILDMPAGIGPNVSVATKVADLILVVATPDPVCIRDGNKLVSIMNQSHAKEMRLVINKASLRNIKSKVVRDLDDVIDGIGLQLIGVIADDISVQTAFAKGMRLDASDKNTTAFRNVARRIDGEYCSLCVY
ncbi:MAG: minD [Oscillospiraceae bacterium]|jgi:septum site-determining protein MinD|nr:minD [Oscillospiraceae bacterium]